MQKLGQIASWPDLVRTRFEEYIQQMQEEASEDMAVVTSSGEGGDESTMSVKPSSLFAAAQRYPQGGAGVGDMLHKAAGGSSSAASHCKQTQREAPAEKSESSQSEDLPLLLRTFTLSNFHTLKPGSKAHLYL